MHLLSPPASKPSLFSSFSQILLAHAAQYPALPAVFGLNRPPLSYAALHDQSQAVVMQLNALGLGRGDRIAVVLPNGPEMASAFVGVAAGATCAPLNPAYRAAEFAYYLEDLKAKALIVKDGVETSAADAARALSIPILRLVSGSENCAGSFTLLSDAIQQRVIDAEARPRWSASDDVALVLHTSGTTARPKIVPLTQANLCASARNIAQTLHLTREDRCLNIMPLFHIHGLIGALLSTLTTAGSICCTPGFSAPDFASWLAQINPTWYTAVPTMHQAIIARAGSSRLPASGQRGDTALRLIRSSSAALPPTVMAGLEDLFGVPVLESYGMTEAAHQMASNLLPPQLRKPGSVGLPAGPEMAVMSEEGRLGAPGAIGEVVIRGANVTLGYDGNPSATADAWTDGWFRTGDQGYFDPDGYLFLTGRLKELINRGGEKIAPREIDEVLLEHPAVMQAVTFAAPDVRLGEEVMAAVVLRPEQSLAGDKMLERALRALVAARLSDFKVPARIIFVAEIPKGPTGKVQRIGLAALLGVTTATDSAAQTSRESLSALPTPLETDVLALCRDILAREHIGLHDNFFLIGGDSLLAARLMIRLEQSQGVTLTLVRLFETPTAAGIALAIQEAQSKHETEEDRIADLLAEMELLTEEEAAQMLQHVSMADPLATLASQGAKEQHAGA